MCSQSILSRFSSRFVTLPGLPPSPPPPPPALSQPSRSSPPQPLPSPLEAPPHHHVFAACGRSRAATTPKSGCSPFFSCCDRQVQHRLESACLSLCTKESSNWLQKRVAPLQRPFPTPWPILGKPEHSHLCHADTAAEQACVCVKAA